mmetsp:Transcript_73536/g.146249  ORF Transcript_73536/g.146249 Transcript_73536/m.146249 type:complete len:85 (-) Transcript_73536:201-455(-)
MQYALRHYCASAALEAGQATLEAASLLEWSADQTWVTCEVEAEAPVDRAAAEDADAAADADAEAEAQVEGEPAASAVVHCLATS